MIRICCSHHAVLLLSYANKLISRMLICWFFFQMPSMDTRCIYHSWMSRWANVARAEILDRNIRNSNRNKKILCIKIKMAVIFKLTYKILCNSFSIHVLIIFRSEAFSNGNICSTSMIFLEISNSYYDIVVIAVYSFQNDICTVI